MTQSLSLSLSLQVLLKACSMNQYSSLSTLAKCCARGMREPHRTYITHVEACMSLAKEQGGAPSCCGTQQTRTRGAWLPIELGGCQLKYQLIDNNITHIWNLSHIFHELRATSLGFWVRALCIRHVTRRVWEISTRVQKRMTVHVAVGEPTVAGFSAHTDYHAGYDTRQWSNVTSVKKIKYFVKFWSKDCLERGGSEKLTKE